MTPNSQYTCIKSKLTLVIPFILFFTWYILQLTTNSKNALKMLENKDYDESAHYDLSKNEKSVKPTKEKSKSKNQIKVLIVARWRSGSTFTSSLLAAHPDSLYVFEPLFNEGLMPLAPRRELIFLGGVSR